MSKPQPASPANYGLVLNLSDCEYRLIQSADNHYLIESDDFPFELSEVLGAEVDSSIFVNKHTPCNDGFVKWIIGKLFVPGQSNFWGIFYCVEDPYRRNNNDRCFGRIELTMWDNTPEGVLSFDAFVDKSIVSITREAFKRVINVYKDMAFFFECNGQIMFENAAPMNVLVSRIPSKEINHNQFYFPELQLLSDSVVANWKLHAGYKIAYYFLKYQQLDHFKFEVCSSYIMNKSDHQIAVSIDLMEVNRCHVDDLEGEEILEFCTEISSNLNEGHFQAIYMNNGSSVKNGSFSISREQVAHLIADPSNVLCQNIFMLMKNSHQNHFPHLRDA